MHLKISMFTLRKYNGKFIIRTKELFLGQLAYAISSASSSFLLTVFHLEEKLY